MRRAFKATPRSIALSQPFIAPAHYQRAGAPLGFDLRTGRVVWFFPWSLPAHSTTFAVEGEKNSGKSTYLKTVAPRLMCFQASDAYGKPDLMRGRFNSRRSEEGIAEYKQTTDFLHAPVYDLGANAGINLFGLFSREVDLIEVMINIAQEINQGPIGEDAALAYMVGIRHMLRNTSEIASPPALLVALQKLTLESFREYHLDNNAKLMAQFNSEMDARPELKEQLQITSADVPLDQRVLDGRNKAISLLNQLLFGNYGESFGGNNSLYEVLSQRLVTLNWENMPDRAQVVLEAVLMKAESSAIVRSQATGELAKPDFRLNAKNLDLTRIIPHINMSDEEGSAMWSLMHARFAADRQNKSRAYPTADFRAYQYYTQVTAAGSEGSAIRSLAQQIDLGVGCRFIFRQPNDEDFLHRFSRLGLSDVDIAQLPELDVGQAMIWIRDHPPLYYQHVLLEPELPLIKSNSARTRMQKPIPVVQSDEFKRHAEKFGNVVIGGQ